MTRVKLISFPRARAKLETGCKKTGMLECRTRFTKSVHHQVCADSSHSSVSNFALKPRSHERDQQRQQQADVKNPLRDDGWQCAAGAIGEIQQTNCNADQQRQR